MRTPSIATAILLLVACAPPPPPDVSLAGTDLVASFNEDRTALLIEFQGLDSESGACPTIDRAGVTFAGKPLPKDDLQSGGSTLGEAGCAAVRINTTLPTTAVPEDGELVVESGGATVSWAAQGLLATRRFVRVGDVDNQVPRGSLVRITHEPATDLLFAPIAVVLADDAELSLNFRLDVDGIIVDIPGAASPGPQTLDVTVPVEVPTLTCDGFASCSLMGEHFQQLPLTIAP